MLRLRSKSSLLLALGISSIALSKVEPFGTSEPHWMVSRVDHHWSISTSHKYTFSVECYKEFLDRYIYSDGVSEKLMINHKEKAEQRP